MRSLEVQCTGLQCSSGGLSLGGISTAILSAIVENCSLNTIYISCGFEICFPFVLIRGIAVSFSFSMLKYSKIGWGERANRRVMGDKSQGATDQGRMGTDARSRERQARKTSGGWNGRQGYSKTKRGR